MSQTELIPFGKFKGQPVTQLEHDPQYAQWILSTPGLKDKYPRFYSVVVNNFGEPADSPEHNGFQAMFLDEWFAMSVGFKAIGKSADDLAAIYEGIRVDYPRFQHLACDMEFEVRGWDVILKPVGVVLSDDGPRRLGHFGSQKFIELKPSIGEDFPAVMRQVKQRLHELRKLDRFQVCVIAREFTAESVTFENVVKMFALSKIQLLLLRDIPVISEQQFKSL